MTLDEYIRELQQLSAEGHGDKLVLISYDTSSDWPSWGCPHDPEIYSFEDSDPGRFEMDRSLVGQTVVIL